MKTVTIIGGGLAGISAATHLAESGWNVTLLEKRSILGGRASSVVDPETGQTIDNCQHVLLGCCIELMDFYKKIGVESNIHFQKEYLFITPDQKVSKLKGIFFPAPFHILFSFIKLTFLNFIDKASIFYAMAIILFTSTKKINALEKISFLEWLQKHHQTQKSIERFWKIILVSALNEDLDQISTKYAFKTFQETFLKNRNGYQMGVPTLPLSKLYSEPTIEFLKHHGGKVLFQKKASKLRISENKISGIELSDGSIISSDIYVCALPFQELVDILPAELFNQYPEFNNIKSLKTSPITGIHLFFDKIVMEAESMIVLDRTIQWIFNKSKNFSNQTLTGQYLQIVISASKDLISKTKNEIVNLVLKELQEIFPKVKQAHLLRSVVIKELHATFSPDPGSDALRLSQKTPIQNLFLAGDWTKTEWPATMEGAVRSGHAAAKAILG